MTDRQGQAGRAWGGQTDRQEQRRQALPPLGGPCSALPRGGPAFAPKPLPLPPRSAPGAPPRQAWPSAAGPPCTAYTHGHSEPVSWSAQQGHYASQGAAWGQKAHPQDAWSTVSGTCLTHPNPVPAATTGLRATAA